MKRCYFHQSDWRTAQPTTTATKIQRWIFQTWLPLPFFALFHVLGVTKLCNEWIVSQKKIEGGRVCLFVRLMDTGNFFMFEWNVKRFKKQCLATKIIERIPELWQNCLKQVSQRLTDIVSCSQETINLTKVHCLFKFFLCFFVCFVFRTCEYRNSAQLRKFFLISSPFNSLFLNVVWGHN